MLAFIQEFKSMQPDFIEHQGSQCHKNYPMLNSNKDRRF